MPETRWSSVRGQIARLTKLDSCGLPDYGSCTTLVTDGYISVAYSPQIEDGDEITVKKANGTLCISDKACNLLKRIDVEVSFCQVDPQAFSMMTGHDVVTDYAGKAVGNRLAATVSCTSAFALEVWSDVPGAICATSDSKPYGYFLLPFVANGQVGDFTVENDAATFTVSGYTKSGSGWNTGPYDVDAADIDNTPGPLLTPIGALDHMDMHLTTVSPPAVTDGCVALASPSVPSTAPVLTLVADDGEGLATLSWTSATGATTYRLIDCNGVQTSFATSGSHAGIAYDPDDAPCTYTVYGHNVDGLGPASNTVDLGTVFP